MADVYIYKRDPYHPDMTPTPSATNPHDIEACWRSVAGWFGYHWAADQVPRVSLYCCNYFAVSRANILRVPRQVWAKAGAYTRSLLSST